LADLSQQGLGMYRKLAGRVSAAAFILFAILIAATPREALAHAVLLSSTPQKNGAVSGPNLNIQLKYNSRVDGGRSALSLLTPDGKVERINGLTQSAPDSITAVSHGLAKGTYVLRWQVLSADGHITRGEVPFRVD
jgi:methionine-rich copper-binding protein CopC